MFTTALQELDLAKNEAILYEVLVDKGDLSVSDLARESGINRRNIYDTLARLLEKGLVYEVKLPKETIYKAVNPRKLREILQEKEQKLEEVIPELERMYNVVPREEEIYIFKGLEGWKNYLHLMLEVGEDVHTIGGKGIFSDERLKPHVKYWLQQMNERGLKSHILFDYVVKEENRAVLSILTENRRFLPKGYDTKATTDVFGEYVVISTELGGGLLDSSSPFTVIKNKEIADSFRTWFKLLWEQASEE